MVGVTLYSSPFAIFDIVPRRIFPDLVFGRAFTTATFLKLAAENERVQGLGESENHVTTLIQAKSITNKMLSLLTYRSQQISDTIDELSF